jgi:hypothetical protein
MPLPVITSPQRKREIAPEEAEGVPPAVRLAPWMSGVIFRALSSRLAMSSG